MIGARLDVKQAEHLVIMREPDSPARHFRVARSRVTSAPGRDFDTSKNEASGRSRASANL